MSNHVKQYTLNDRQRAMVEAAMPMARFMAAIYTRPGVEMDDLCQQAYLGLCDAADNYRPGGSATFATFARRHVTESIEVYIQRYGPGRMLSRMSEDAYAETIPLDEPDEKGENLPPVETIEDTSQQDPMEEAEEKMLKEATVQRLTSQLTIEEREYVTVYFNDERNDRENPIWKRFNMGKSAYYARLQAAIIKMKVYAEHNNINPLN